MLLKSLGSAFFAKVGVEGSNPFARSKKTLTKSAHLADFRACVVASLCLNKPRTVPTSVIDLGNRWAKCSRNVPRAVDRGHWPIDPFGRSGALRRLDPQAERRAVARSRNAAGGHCRSMLIGFVETRGRVQRRSVSVHCSGEPCENRAWSRLDGFLTLIQLLQRPPTTRRLKSVHLRSSRPDTDVADWSLHDPVQTLDVQRNRLHNGWRTR